MGSQSPFGFGQPSQFGQQNLFGLQSSGQSPFQTSSFSPQSSAFSDFNSPFGLSNSLGGLRSPQLGFGQTSNQLGFGQTSSQLGFGQNSNQLGFGQSNNQLGLQNSLQGSFPSSNQLLLSGGQFADSNSQNFGSSFGSNRLPFGTASQNTRFASFGNPLFGSQFGSLSNGQFSGVSLNDPFNQQPNFLSGSSSFGDESGQIRPLRSGLFQNDRSAPFNGNVPSDGSRFQNGLNQFIPSTLSNQQFGSFNPLGRLLTGGSSPLSNRINPLSDQVHPFSNQNQQLSPNGNAFPNPTFERRPFPPAGSLGNGMNSLNGNVDNQNNNQPRPFQVHSMTDAGFSCAGRIPGNFLYIHRITVFYRVS